MKSLEVIVTVSNDGQLSINPPLDIPTGAYKAILVIDEQPLLSAPSSVESAQAIVRQYISANRNLSQELIQERRQEASYE